MAADLVASGSVYSHGGEQAAFAAKAATSIIPVVGSVASSDQAAISLARQ